MGCETKHPQEDTYINNKTPNIWILYNIYITFERRWVKDDAFFMQPPKRHLRIYVTFERCWVKKTMLSLWGVISRFFEKQWSLIFGWATKNGSLEWTCPPQKNLINGTWKHPFRKKGETETSNKPPILVGFQPLVSRGFIQIYALPPPSVRNVKDGPLAREFPSHPQSSAPPAVRMLGWISTPTWRIIPVSK